MNKEWLEKINMTLEERANLEMWCENIGYKRYESICNSIIEKTKRKSVNYSVLQVIAKYDFCLSDFLHSMLKFIELRFRSYLDNNYGELLITRQEFLYQISNKLTNGKRRLDCSTYYDKKLKDETTLGEFLTASNMETLLRVLFLLPKKELEVFNKNIAQLKEELTKIKNARNYVAHGQVLLFNEKFNLKEMIVLMLKYMPTKESKLKRIDELDKLNKRLFEEECKLPNILRESVSIVLKKKEFEEIGL